MAPSNQTVAFTRIHIDRRSEPEVAVEMGLPIDEVQRLAEVELVRRRRTGALPKHLLEPTKFQHVMIGTEDRTCSDHGPYLAQQWELQPKTPVTPSFWGNCPQCDRLWQAEADAKEAEVRTGVTEKQRMAAIRIAAATPTR